MVREARSLRTLGALSRFVAARTSVALATTSRHARMRATRPAPADHLVVATANVQYQQQEARLIDLVATLNERELTRPHVVCLQEVQGHDDGEGHTIYQLADLFEMSMRFEGARRYPLVGALKGSFGNAVLSCAGFAAETKKIDLPGGWEHRIAVDAQVPLTEAGADGSAVRVLAAHLDHGGLRGYRDDNVPGRAQLERLIDVAERDLVPTVIAGDFNLTPDVVARILKGSRFVDPARDRACHARGTAGRRRIDYILVDSAAFDVVEIDVCPLYGREGRKDISDHHAVVAILKKKSAAPATTNEQQ